MAEGEIKGERIGQICIQEGLISQQQLNEVLAIQQKQGGRIGWILSSMGLIKRIDLFRVLSRHYGLKFATPEYNHIKEQIDKSLVDKIAREEVLHWQAVPYQITKDNHLIILNAYPGNAKAIEFYKRYFSVERVIEWVITDLDLVALVQSVYAQKLADDSIFGLFYREPDESAYRVFSGPQVAFFAFLTIVAGLFFFYHPLKTTGMLIFIAQLIYLIMIGFKFILTINGSIDEIIYEERVEELQGIPDSQLPVYTVLVPVFKEPDVIKTLIKAIKNF